MKWNVSSTRISYKIHTLQVHCNNSSRWGTPSLVRIRMYTVYFIVFNIIFNLCEKGYRCPSNAAWIPAGDHINSGQWWRNTVAFVVLNLKIGGFKGREDMVGTERVKVAQFSMSFELDCSDDCSLILLLVSRAYIHLVLQHRMFRRYFRERFAKISILRIEFFKNFANNFKIVGKQM